MPKWQIKNTKMCIKLHNDKCQIKKCQNDKLKNTKMWIKLHNEKWQIKNAKMTNKKHQNVYKTT